MGQRAAIGRLDPDVQQAVDDLRNVALALRVAEARLAELPRCATLRAAAAAREAVGEAKGRIKLRADRIGITPAALRLILDEAEALRRACGRKPSGREIGAALALQLGQHRVEEGEAEARREAAGRAFETAVSDEWKAKAARFTAESALAALRGEPVPTAPTVEMAS